MATVAEAFVTLRPDLSSFKSETERGLGTLGGIAAKAGLAIAGAGAAVGAVGFAFNDMRQQAEIAFTTMLGSGERAKTFLDELQAFAAATPFAFEDLVRGSQRLLAMGFSAEQIKPMLTSVGDAVAGLGLGSEGIDRVTRALGQMQAKGKVSAGEMLQLAEAGIPAWEFLAEKIGVSIPQAMKMAELGAIPAGIAIEGIVEGMDAKFGGLMEKQSRTFSGFLSTIKDTFSIAAGKVMRPFFDEATKMLEGLAAFMGTPEFAAGLETFMGFLGTIFGTIKEMIAVVTGLDPAAGGILKNALGPEVAEAVMGALANIRRGFAFLAENIDATMFAVKVLAAVWVAAMIPAAIATVAAFAPVILAIAAIAATAFLLHKAWEALTSFASTAIPAMGALVQDVMSAIGGALEEAGRFVVGLWTTAQEAFAGITSAIGAFIGTTLATIGAWVETALGLWRTFTENPPRMVGIMLGLIIGALLNLAQAIGDFTGRAAQAFLEWIRSTASTVGDFFAALPGRLGAWLGATFDAIGTFVSSALAAFVAWVGSTASTIGTFFSELPDRIGAWLASTLRNIGLFGESATAATGQWVGDTANTIGTFFGSLPERMWQWGVQAVQGFLGGLGSMKDAAFRAVGDLFGGIVDGVKSSLRIGSPSKVFEEIGHNMIAGLEAGLGGSPQLGVLGGLGGVRAGGGMDMTALGQAIAGEISRNTRPINLSVHTLDPNDTERLVARGMRSAALEWR